MRGSEAGQKLSLAFFFLLFFVGAINGLFDKSRRILLKGEVHHFYPFEVFPLKELDTNSK